MTDSSIDQSVSLTNSDEEDRSSKVNTELPINDTTNDAVVSNLPPQEKWNNIEVELTISVKGKSQILQKHSDKNYSSRNGVLNHNDDGVHVTTAGPTTVGPPYISKENECSVQSCLNGFTASELLSGNNKVCCDACTKRINGESGKSVNTNASKQFLISSLPAVLILHLKRFQLGPRHIFRKLGKDVTFPFLLDVAPFCSASPKIKKPHRSVDRNQKTILYSLYGVVEHSGSMHGGHYVAYVKIRPKLKSDDPRWKFVSKLINNNNNINEQHQGDIANGNDIHVSTNEYDSDESTTSANTTTSSSSSSDANSTASSFNDINIQPPPGKWYYASDSHVQEVDENRVSKAQAYLLFYERIY